MAVKDLVQASPNPAGDVDNFEHILQVTSHQEAVYAYYYMDENNKVSLLRKKIFITVLESTNSYNILL